VPPIELDDKVALGLDIVVWIVAGFAAGYAAHRRSLERLGRVGPVTRLRRFEQGGRWYERRLRIKRWKDRLPEAGAFFAGGVSKKHLVGRDPASLQRFVLESRRAELTHWWVLGVGPLLFLWNPVWLAVVMCVYAAAANVPCLLVQRYNRARLLRVLARASATP
jgi:glycosyl-4,4'-diaponeurosporenoate acyltransferase